MTCTHGGDNDNKFNLEQLTPDEILHMSADDLYELNKKLKSKMDNMSAAEEEHITLLFETVKEQLMMREKSADGDVIL